VGLPADRFQRLHPLPWWIIASTAASWSGRSWPAKSSFSGEPPAPIRLPRRTSTQAHPRRSGRSPALPALPAADTSAERPGRPLLLPLPAQGSHLVATAAEAPKDRQLLQCGSGTIGSGCLRNRRGFRLRVHGVSHRASARVGLPVDSIALPLAHRHNQHQHLPIPHLVDAAKSG